MKEWSGLKKTLVIAGVAILGLAGIGSVTSQQNNTTAPTATPTAVQGESTTTTTQQTVTPVETTPTQKTPTTDQSNLSNNNTYTNVDGNTVRSPAYTSDGSIPEGASAKCVDGTYSFSQHRQGTCSHHGGVATWY